MKDFFYRQAISLILGLIDGSFKNIKSKNKWREILCQLARQIDLLYPERLYEKNTMAEKTTGKTGSSTPLGSK